jgi:glycine/D-amino acid oxidase-like deaminating enzyme
MSASGNLFYGFGYSGSGVGPCHMGGQILASMVQGLDNPWTRSPLVNGPLGFFRRNRFVTLAR